MDWETGTSDLHWKALQMYLYVSLPLTFVVVAIWAVLQVMERHKEKKREERIDGQSLDTYAC